MMWRCMLFVLWATTCVADPVSLAQINHERAEAGRQALAWSAELARAAQRHAEDMAKRGYFSHEGADGSDVKTRAGRAGYSGCFWAENIAKGQRDLDQVLASWMGSRGHRRNILERRARDVGLYQADGRIWVMVLGAPCR